MSAPLEERGAEGPAAPLGAAAGDAGDAGGPGAHGRPPDRPEAASNDPARGSVAPGERPAGGPSTGAGGAGSAGGGSRPAIVAARGVVKEYAGADAEAAGVVALRGVDLEVEAGDWLAIVGPSGCGKSTLLNVLAGIDHPTSGSIVLLGEELGRVGEAERARLRLTKVGFVFQRFHLLTVLSARENVELPMAEAGVARRERRERSAQLLDFVGLGHRMDHRPTRLSGGEQQRVAIARALANRPLVIFADEPTGELDQKTGAQILDLFRLLNDDGTTVITVTHDAEAASRANRLIEMMDGRIVAERRGGR